MSDHSLPDRSHQDSQAYYDKKYIGRPEPPQGIVTSGQFSNTCAADAGGSPQNRSGSSQDA